MTNLLGGENPGNGYPLSVMRRSLSYGGRLTSAKKALGLAPRCRYAPGMKGYGQFCPVAKASEVFGERWTPLIVRELLCGSARFNDIRRGVPLMSQSLLTKRLRQLEESGVIRRERCDTGWKYKLTEAGEALRPAVEILGHWGARWVRSQLSRDDLDPGLLIWDIRRCAERERFPPDRCVVIQFQFTDAPRNKRLWWLVTRDEEVDLCLEDPGQEVTLILLATVRALTEIWTGDLDPPAALRRGDIKLQGAARDADKVWTWLGRSPFASTRHQARVQTSS